MALVKEITNELGIVGNYHRISNVIKKYESIVVEISSYANEEYRNMEKEAEDLTKELAGSTEKLYELSSGVRTEEKQNQIDEIEAKQKRLSYLLQIYSPFGQGTVIFKTIVNLPWANNTEISFETIYDRLLDGDSIFANMRGDQNG